MAAFQSSVPGIPDTLITFGLCQSTCLLDHVGGRLYEGRRQDWQALESLDNGEGLEDGPNSVSPLASGLEKHIQETARGRGQQCHCEGRGAQAASLAPAQSRDQGAGSRNLGSRFCI
ncbi:hypothetical protein TREES_T100000948 [Tupaia chinensis]|uniref:Uncharacterized protein n=1 Tax=Tupaia chinensis TaxID=246437 RepID=L9JGP4_TUPCH|nr:hypothetical protein TREES_T100000948 [Tupaia chinensis]